MYEEGTQNIVDYMVVDGNEYDIHPSNRLETCEHNVGEEPIGMFSQVCDVDCQTNFCRQ